MYNSGLFKKTYRYLNGNYLVVVNNDKSKHAYDITKRTLRIGEDFKSVFPDSIDLKITNKCSWGCPFCHESSVATGKTMDLEKTKQILSQLPELPIEIAIGGGNVLDCFPELVELTDWLLERNNKVRITLNSKDLWRKEKDPGTKEIINFINSKIDALGVSLNSFGDFNVRSREWMPDLSLTEEEIKKNKQEQTIWNNLYSPTIVYHVIAGIYPLSDLRKLAEATSSSILILGYKQWGRAKGTEIPDLTGWREEIKSLISDGIKSNCLGFDNLACEQLGIKEILGEKAWKVFYMGDEGTCSMYIDAVEGTFARTSRSPERVSWDDVKLLDYYASLSR